MKNVSASPAQVRIAAVALLFAALSQPAFANDEKDCAELSGNAAVEACTRGINSGRYQGDTLAKIYYNRAYELEDLGELKRALEDLNQSLRINPRDGAAYRNRGLVREKLKDIDGAFADYTQSIAYARNARAYNNRGLLYADKKDYAKAIEDFNQANLADPKFALPFHNRAEIYERQDKIDLAIKDYSESIRLNPKYARSYAARGRLYRARGDKERAIEDFRAALELNPKDVDSRANLEQLGEKLPN